MLHEHRYLQVGRLLVQKCSSLAELASLARQGRSICNAHTPNVLSPLLSDLLPIELGDCDYEKGTDGKLFTVLTDPTVLSFDLIQEEWDVDCLLNQIAHKPYGAAILVSTKHPLTHRSRLALQCAH